MPPNHLDVPSHLGDAPSHIPAFGTTAPCHPVATSISSSLFLSPTPTPRDVPSPNAPCHSTTTTPTPFAAATPGPTSGVSAQHHASSMIESAVLAVSNAFAAAANAAAAAALVSLFLPYLSRVVSVSAGRGACCRRVGAS